MRVKHQVAIKLAGTVWMGIGVMLMTKGLPLIAKAKAIESLPLIHFIKPFVGTAEQASMVLVVTGLLIGFIKGKTVLTKAARKAILRIKSQPEPMPISRLYNGRYLILLGFMMALGIALRFIKPPYDIHGVIDLAVGSALVNGAMVYFREKPQSICDTENPS